MVIIVVIMGFFVIVWFLFFVFNMIVEFCFLCLLLYFDILRLVCFVKWMYYFNSMVNLLVYVYCNVEMRKIFKWFLLFCFCGY